MKYKVAQAVGLNTDQEAALVLSSISDDGNVFLVVLKLTCDDAFTKGRQVISDLEDFYRENEETIANKLSKTFSKAEELLQGTEKFNLILSVISGKVLYFIIQGDVSVNLKRGDKISSLSGVAASGQLVSGFISEYDRLLLATNSLVNFFGEGMERSLNLPLTTWEEETNSDIGSVSLGDHGLAGLVVDASPDVEEGSGFA